MTFDKTSLFLPKFTASKTLASSHQVRLSIYRSNLINKFWIDRYNLGKNQSFNKLGRPNVVYWVIRHRPKKETDKNSYSHPKVQINFHSRTIYLLKYLNCKKKHVLQFRRSLKTSSLSLLWGTQSLRFSRWEIFKIGSLVPLSINSEKTFQKIKKACSTKVES